MNQIDISVVVPIYNAEKYLSKCIESLIKQTKEIEIVLVNDGSTDASPNIINKYAAKYKNIVVVNQKNLGLTGARISGIKATHGKYIGWVDADDFVELDMYEKLYRLVVDEDADLVYCDYDYYPKSVRQRVKWFQEYKGVKDASFIDKNTQITNKLFSRELLDKTRMIDNLKKCNEYATIPAMLAANKISYIKEKLYHYRIGHLSMSGGGYDGKVEHYQEGVKSTIRLIELVSSDITDDRLKLYFEYRYIYALILVCIVAAKNKDKSTFYEAKTKLEDINYQNNPYTMSLTRKHYGWGKSIIMTKIMPKYYFIAKLLASLALPSKNEKYDGKL